MSKRALNNPTFWQENEAFFVTRTQGHLDFNTKIIADPCRKVRAIVTAIDQDFLKTVPERIRYLLQQTLGSSTLTHIGSMSNDLQQVAHRIDQDMTFASVYLLATIEAMFTAHFCRFHALAVDNRQTRICRSARCLPSLFPQGCVHRLPRLVPTPFVKMVVHAVKVRILMRQI